MMKVVGTNSKPGYWKTTTSLLIANGAIDEVWQASSKILVKNYAMSKTHQGTIIYFYTHIVNSKNSK